jgi:hypothetical protein
LIETLQDAFDALISEMEGFPPGAWELARPNITSWAQDLVDVTPTKAINEARDRIFDLGKRIDTICRIVIHDEERSTDEEKAPGNPSEAEDDEEEEASPGEVLLKNQHAVSSVQIILSDNAKLSCVV